MRVVTLEIFTLISLHCWYLYSINDGGISKSDGTIDHYVILTIADVV
jgi:hypothetical protein